LMSCVVEMQNVVGDTIPESLLTDAATKCNYDPEKALAMVLSAEPAQKSTIKNPVQSTQSSNQPRKSHLPPGFDGKTFFAVT